MGFQWYLFDYENDNREPTYTQTVFSWEFPYYMINQLNQFIVGVNGSATLSEIEKEGLLGQAYHACILLFSTRHGFNTLILMTLHFPSIYSEPAAERDVNFG